MFTGESFVSSKAMWSSMEILFYLGLIVCSFVWLPRFPRAVVEFSTISLATCWFAAFIGASFPVALKQRAPSLRFWRVLFWLSIICGSIGFTLLFLWWERQAQRSPNFPGLGAVIFLGVAAIISCGLSFVLGWLIPSASDAHKDLHR